MPWSLPATNGGNRERFGCHDCSCSTRRVAALAGDVIVLQSLFPSLAWVGNPSVELSLKKVEDDIELLFRAVQAFEDHLQQTES